MNARRHLSPARHRVRLRPSADDILTLLRTVKGTSWVSWGGSTPSTFYILMEVVALDLPVVTRQCVP